MDAGETLYGIMSALPCPVSQTPGQGGESYCVYNLIDGRFRAHASNEPGRVQHMAQVHLFSTKDDGTHLDLMNQAIGLLKAAGVRVFGWGPDLYEADTLRHHTAITVIFVEKYIEQEEPAQDDPVTPAVNEEE